MATYTKLRDGSWGLRVEGTARVGSTVSVRKKDGTMKTETVSKVVWEGNGVALCTIATSSAPTTTTRRRSSGGNVCAECGRGGALVADLEDGLLKHYGCCDIAP